MHDMFDKVVLVTGAARRVGAAIARRVHAQGARVVLHYRGAEKDAAALEAELNALRPKSAWRVRADLLAHSAPELLVRTAKEKFGRLDVLVNNASSFFPTALGEIEEKGWEELMGANVKAPLL
ncbi:MAG: SDR family NAD(P)-dependent oxidoreductase, partial [Betaproteobacteria bacterium]